MAPEPIEQVVRIVAKSEVDAGVKQAQQQFRDFGGTVSTAFDPKIINNFGSEAGKTFNRIGSQFRSLQPFIGTFRQLFGGFTLFAFAHRGVDALIDSVSNYIRVADEAAETTRRLARQASVLGLSSQGGAELFTRSRAFLTQPLAFGGARFSPEEATKVAEVITRLTTALGQSDQQIQKAQAFAIALTDLGVGVNDAAKAVEAFIRASAGQRAGFTSLSDILGIEITPQNIGDLKELTTQLKIIETLRLPGGAQSVFANLGITPTEINSIIKGLEERIRSLGFRSEEAVKGQIDAIKELADETDRNIRKQKELDDAIRRGRGTPGEQIQLAIQDATKLVNVYSLASEGIQSIVGGLQDVTAETVRWAVAQEGGALKLRSLLAGIAGQLAGIIAQYIFLRILAGAGGAALPAAGPSYPSNFIGPRPAGSGASAGLRTGGGAYSAGLSGGGGGPSSAGGGGDGNLVVVDEGQAWFNRRLVAAGGLVLQVVQAGKAGNPDFKNALRKRF